MAETSEIVNTEKAAPSPKKGKAAAKAKKPRVTPSHPKTSDMVNAAITNLKERGGSSLQAIKKYVGATYKVDVEKLSPFIKKYLKSAVATGALVQTKGKGASGSFKLSAGKAEKKADSKPKKTAAPKASKTTKGSPAKKSKPAAKKPKKKSAAAAAKPAAKKATAAKKKAAAPSAAKPKKATKSPKKEKKAKVQKKPKSPKPKKASGGKKTAAKK
jgi:hypothetical protein